MVLLNLYKFIILAWERSDRANANDNCTVDTFIEIECRVAFYFYLGEENALIHFFDIHSERSAFCFCSYPGH